MVQHKANPIPETIERVPNFGTLSIYKIPDSRYWQARVFIGRIIKKSLKTENKIDAIKGAKDFYHDLINKKRNNEPLTSSPTFERVALELMKEDQDRADRGEVSSRLPQEEKKIINADILPFFRKDNIKDVNYQRINAYLEHLKKSRKKALAPATIKLHFNYLNKILKHGCKLGLIDKVPIFPKIHVVDNPRAWFEKTQWDKLLATIDNEIKAKAVVRYHPITIELNYLCWFMVSSYCRPSDIKILKNNNIEICRSRIGKYLRITTASAKTNNAPFVTGTKAVEIYGKIQKFQKSRGFGNADDFVFFPSLKNRAFALQTMQRQFKHVLEKAGLKVSVTGQSRTLYSLRHTAIMVALKERGIDYFTVAKNSRTSVGMIERFYGSHLENEMNVEKFQLPRKSKSKKSDSNNGSSDTCQ